MLCEAYSVRESSGIARWLQDVSGVVCQFAGEDALAPDDTTHDTAERSPYWGLTVGQQLESQQRPDQTTLLIIERVFTLVIAPATAHDYLLIVGTTFVTVTVPDTAIQADVPGLLDTAWKKAGLHLSSVGDENVAGALVLSSIDDTTFRVTTTPIAGGIPTFDYGWGLTWIGDVVTATPWELKTLIVTHTYIATYWGWVRGRGEAKRACLAMENAATEDDTADLLKRYTGQRAVITGVAVLDALALSGGPQGNMDVAQVEIVVDALVISAKPASGPLAGLALTLTALSDVPGDTLTQDPITLDLENG